MVLHRQKRDISRPTWTRTWECGGKREGGPQSAVAMATTSPRITAPLCSATKREKEKQSYIERGWMVGGAGGQG